jgi:replication initiation and membrane attachment protein DnaB
VLVNIQIMRTLPSSENLFLLIKNLLLNFSFLKKDMTITINR